MGFKAKGVHTYACGGLLQNLLTKSTVHKWQIMPLVQDTTRTNLCNVIADRDKGLIMMPDVAQSPTVYGKYKVIFTEISSAQ